MGVFVVFVESNVYFKRLLVNNRKPSNNLTNIEVIEYLSIVCQ